VSERLRGMEGGRGRMKGGEEEGKRKGESEGGDDGGRRAREEE
jgi:hypothetical protein